MGKLKYGRRRGSNVRIVVGAIMMALTILWVTGGTATAAGEPRTVAEIALYQGPDREKILLEGAKKEGQLTFYHSWVWMGKVVQEFEKKYPFLKVAAWRNDAQNVLKRIVEEYTANRFYIDVIESSAPAVLVLTAKGIFQEYYTPEMGYYGNEVKASGKTGVYYIGHLEDVISLGFNTNRVPPSAAPKNLQDLLDPRWKGKMSIAGSSTGIRWLGNAQDIMGPDFIEKLSRQDIKVQNISGAALAGLVVSGEVPLSPTIYEGNVITARQKGAPIEWRPLEPVVTNSGYSGIATRALHPYGALLFLDYLHSREGQKAVMLGGLRSPREDMGLPGGKFKKSYLEDRFKTLEEYENKYDEWENLLRNRFIKGK